MREIKPDMPETDLQSLLARLDINGDGSIDFDEFYSGFNTIILEQQQKILTAEAPRSTAVNG
jgi:hypothetical protein